MKVVVRRVQYICVWIQLRRSDRLVEAVLLLGIVKQRVFPGTQLVIGSHLIWSIWANDAVWSDKRGSIVILHIEWT